MDDLKNRITSWMVQYACGYRQITPRHKICEALNLEDRLFREICAQIPEIITNSATKQIKEWGYTITVRKGYYILPLVDTAGFESKIALILLRENRSRIVKLWKREKDKTKLVRDRYGRERQATFV